MGDADSGMRLLVADLSSRLEEFRLAPDGEADGRFSLVRGRAMDAAGMCQVGETPRSFDAVQKSREIMRRFGEIQPVGSVHAHHILSRLGVSERRSNQGSGFMGLTFLMTGRMAQRLSRRGDSGEARGLWLLLLATLVDAKASSSTRRGNSSTVAAGGGAAAVSVESLIQEVLALAANTPVSLPSIIQSLVRARSQLTLGEVKGTLTTSLEIVLFREVRNLASRRRVLSPYILTAAPSCGGGKIH